MFLNYRFPTPDLEQNLGEALSRFWDKFKQEPAGITVNEKQLEQACQFARKFNMPETITIAGTGGCFATEIWLARPAQPEPVQVEQLKLI
jgi:hypothetical protein